MKLEDCLTPRMPYARYFNLVNIKCRPEPVLKLSTCVAINEDEIISAKCDFNIHGLSIKEGEQGGKAIRLPYSCQGLLNKGVKLGMPVVWVKSGSNYDFNEQEVDRDFLWCTFAEKLDDDYTDEKDASHFYLKEDNLEILWLLDDIDAFECNLFDGFKSFGEIHHNFLHSVAVVPDQCTGEVVLYDNGKPYTKQIPLLGSYDSEKKKVELYIDTIEATARDKNYDFVDLFASTYVHEMMHAYFDRELNVPNGYIQKIEEPMAEAAMIKFMEAFGNTQEKNKVQIRCESIKQFVEDKKAAQETMHYGLGADLAENIGEKVFSYKSGMGDEKYVEEYYKVKRYSEIKKEELINLFNNMLGAK